MPSAARLLAVAAMLLVAAAALYWVVFGVLNLRGDRAGTATLKSEL